MRWFFCWFSVLVGFAGVSSYSVDENFKIKPRDGNFTKQPRGGNYTIQPREGNFTIQPREGNFTIQPREGNFTIQPREGNFTIQPREGNFTIQPREGNFTIQPREGNFTIQPREGNFTIQPREDNFTIQPREGNFTIQPREGNFTIQPREGNFNIHPRDGNFTIQPREGNFTIQPRECKCGLKPIARIVGGTFATMNEYPWMVGLCKGSPCISGRQMCGATLIDSLHCITAAHCVQGLTAEELSVCLGDHNIAVHTETRSIQRKVAEIIRHPGYKPGPEYNDIAILKLASPVKINNKIRPACLPTSQINFENKVGVATGWGTTSSQGSSSKTLKEVSVKIWPNEVCKDRYSNSAITAGMLCAGSENKDSCQGDSGGPLVYNEGGILFLIGVVSWGYGCGHENFPGVYTRVSTHMNFVKANTKGAQQCT